MDLQGVSWLNDQLRSIFCFFDKLIYGLIKWILFGIFDLAHLTTNSNVFSGIYSRIYVILGIFMAFKLTFSFFQYIIDPESMTGKGDKNITKVFSRVFVMLAALIFLPMVLFGNGDSEGFLSRAQNAFLPSVSKVIFGSNNVGGISMSKDADTSDGSTFAQTIEASAEEISISTLRGFFMPNKQIDEVCGAGTYDDSPPIESLNDFENYLNLNCSKTGSGFLGTDLWAAKYYKYNYSYFISTVVGVLVAALLLGITLDIAKRIFKMIILEVIAPVPIMSLIDPKGSKDGAFSKWVKSLTTTFLDIFLKLGLVYIIIVLIHMIVNSGAEGGLFTNFPSNEGFRSTYLTILLILGLIFFAKEAPKFIKEAMGIKDSGGGLFDDVKSIGKAAGLVGGAAVGTAGVIGSTVGNIRAQHQGNQENFKGQHVRNSLRNIGAALSGAVGGTAAAAKGLTGKEAGIKSVMKNQQARNASSFDYRRNGGTMFGRMGAGLSRTFTGETTAAKVEREIAALENEQSLIKAITERAAGEMPKSTKTSGSFGSLGGNYNYKSVKASMDAAIAAGASDFEITDTSGASRKITMKAAYENIGSLLASNEADYIDKSFTGTIDDGKMLSLKTNAEHGGVNLSALVDPSNPKKDNMRKGIKSRLDEIDSRKVASKQRLIRANANDKYSSKKK